MPIFNMVGGGGKGATLVVTAPAGVNVTVSNGDKTKSTIANDSGIATVKGLETGTWTVTISNGNQTSSKTINITTDYDIVMAFFAATIAVTFPEGSTLTCTDGSTTLTATTTTGSYTFTVPNTGTWTVSCTDGDDTDSKAVSITTDGQSASVTLTYFDGYLFNYGSVNEDVTGGWVTKNVPHAAGFEGYPTVASQSDGSVLIYTGTAKSGIYVTKNKIDLSNYSTITFTGYTYDYNGYGRAGLKVWSDIGSLQTDNVVASFYKNSATVATHTIDVSSLTGSYYIGHTVVLDDGKVRLCSLKLS